MKKKYIVILVSVLLLGTIIAILYKSGVNSFFVKEPGNISESSNTEKLKSLPYMTWVPIKKGEEGKSGVVKHIPDLSYQGTNLYNSRARNNAHLISMSGKILHTWSAQTEPWQTVEVNKKGDLFFFVKDKMFGKLDRNSNLQWSVIQRFHHWITLAENGDVYTLTRDRRNINYNNQTIPILDDFITILSPEGEIRKKISIYTLVGEKIPRARLDKIAEIARLYKNTIDKVRMNFDTIFDVFHTNTVRIVDRDIEGLCKKGDLLISIRELNLVAIVNHISEEVIWSWGENILDRQHCPELLSNGNILIFDNGSMRNYSRIIELNPLTREIEWEYKADPPEVFYSLVRGASQKLPNGNILITESAEGHVFEITKKGKIVWEFYNPDIKKNNRRASIFRMIRLTEPIQY